jgi:hypothetical protein
LLNATIDETDLKISWPVRAVRGTWCADGNHDEATRQCPWLKISRLIEGET